jgi:mRNA interferase MazF
MSAASPDAKAPGQGTVDAEAGVDPQRLPPLSIRRGDLFWLAPDGERGSVPGHPHPHLVVQDDVFNRSRLDTVVVCALTSNLKRAQEPGNLLLALGEGGLAKASVVVVSQVACVAKAQLGERIGALPAARVEQVLAGMRFQQASFFGERPT